MNLSILKLFLVSFFMLASQLVLAAPKIEHWETKDGLGVYYVNVPELPMLDLRLTFAAGSAYDGNKPGISSLTTAMLDKGAASMNADQIAEALESAGAQFSSSSARDMATISLRSLTLKDQRDKSLQTWLKLIGKPDFPDADFARLKKQALIGLQAEKQNPGSVASKAFYKHLYGDHPYASPTNGTEESINALKIEDLKAFYKQFFVVKNAQLALVGAINRSDAENIAEQVAKALLSEGRGAGTKPPPIPEVKALTEAKTVHIPFQSAQAHVMIGQPGNKRGDKDYFTLYLGNHTLGGSGFTSRLMKEIRVKRGLSYSVYSYFMPMREFGPFLLGLQTKIAQTDEAIKVAREELEKFRDKGPSEEELNASKTNIIGGFPLRTASNDDIIGYIAMIGFYGLPLDYLDTFTKTIGKIKREEVLDAYKRRLHTDKLLTVIVGGENKDKAKDESKTQGKMNKDITKKEETKDAPQKAEKT